MQLTKVLIEKVDRTKIYVNEYYMCGTVEFEYKDVLYSVNLQDIDFESKESFISKHKDLEDEVYNFELNMYSNTDAVTEVWSSSWVDYMYEILHYFPNIWEINEEILQQFPNFWQLNEERMWNDNNVLTLAENIIEFKKPQMLFDNLEVGTEILISCDGQNTSAVMRNVNPFFNYDIVDISNFISSKAKESEITEYNNFNFVGRKVKDGILFTFEGMEVLISE